MKRLWMIPLFALLMQPAPAVAATYTIDMILPLTGPAAFAGKSQEEAARVYEAVVNKSGGIHGQQLHFEIHDDQSNPTVAVQLANDILQKHPVVVLGPSVTATCAAIAPLFVNGPVDFCFSPVVEPPHGGYVFASSIALRSLLAEGYTRMRSLGYKRVAAIFATDASGQVELQITKDWFAQPANANIKLVDAETFAPTDISVAAQVAKIKAANPDIIYVWAIGTAFGTAIHELSNAGVDVPVVTSPSNTTETQLAQFKTFLPATLVTSGMPYQSTLQNPALKAAASEYLDGMKAAGLKPETMQSYAWDPMRIAVTALRTLPANASAQQLHDYLETMHDIGGIWGIYDFRTGDQHGIAGKDIPYFRYDAAKDAWVYFDLAPKG
ncbi:MAG: ABC transporter substrate-binding protein [Candidatus Lustribacter sp.]|jgi:branched-chain amino acid transport system substrate-binding protein